MGEIIREIEIRRARRALSDRAIPENVVRRILHAATLAPSCSNNQPWRFIAVKEPEGLAKARNTLSGGNYWAKPAPLIMIASTREDLDCRLSDDRNYALLGLGLAVENLILQSFKEGLIAHPIAGFNPLKIKEAFSIPKDFTVIVLIIIGYPGDEDHLSEKHRKDEHAERTRLEESKVISYETWTFESEAEPPSQ
jgi:nitroreductase